MEKNARLILPFLSECFLFILVMLAAFSGCNEGAQNNASSKPMTSRDSGAQLVSQYCGTCHLPVEPAALDKKSWINFVLPAMAPRLGVQVWNKNQYYPASGEIKPLISFSDWGKIVEYYQVNAPDSLALPGLKVSPLKDWFVFDLKTPKQLSSGQSSTLMVAIASSGQRIYTADENNDLLQWNYDLKQTSAFHLPSPAVNMQFAPDSTGRRNAVLTLIGSMLAIDRPAGQAISLDLLPSPSRLNSIAELLPRPVQSVSGDFNKDGLTDWLVCGFGHEKGALYLLTQTPDHHFKKEIIREQPGATQVVTGDFNKDGWTDFICLFAHADEGIWLFTNDHQGKFSAENLLRFAPEYGSTGFQLIDFNKDGRPDILYTCGDNSDYSRILKPYHGIYIFINQGGNTYRQSWFYPVNGCTKAIAADFDLDGDLDIASIAFFADLQHNPGEKFLLFSQDTAMHFIAHSPPLESLGRWISMDAGDYDNDGDLDIILGNYSKGFINQPGFKPDWNQRLPFVLLDNQKR